MVTHLLQQRFNGHLTGNGAEIFAHACRLGHEGIVAKRVDLGYESGRSRRWLKIKNPDSPAMQRVRDDTFRFGATGRSALIDAA